jgi:hypothetical protein
MAKRNVCIRSDSGKRSFSGIHFYVQRTGFAYDDFRSNDLSILSLVSVSIRGGVEELGDHDHALGGWRWSERKDMSLVRDMVWVSE